MMRARGAKVTDIVILVVAADDGVMPQTREAIDHAKAAERADHRGDQQDRQARRQPGARQAGAGRTRPAARGLGRRRRSWSPVSAKKRENLDALLEMVLLVADIGELKANPKRGASGTVLEAKLDRGRGAVATILVQDGTLSVGDTFIAGTIVGKVRALIDDRGRPIKTVGPSTPVEVLGLPTPPSPGDTFQASPTRPRRGRSRSFRQTQPKERRSRQGRPAHARVAASSRSPRAASRSCRSSSRPTCRARPKCWPTRCRSWATSA